MSPATVHHLKQVPDLVEDQPITLVKPPPADTWSAVAAGRSALRVARPVAGTLVRHTGYGVAGMWRAGGAGWRWWTVAELAPHLAAKPEMVVRERERRRTVAKWGGGTGLAAGVWIGVTWWPALVIAAVVVFVVLAIVERRLRNAGTDDEGRKSIGKHPSSKAVRAAVAAAKLGKFDTIRVVGPVARDKEIAWTAVVELPPGGTYVAAAKRHGEIAGALGVGASQLAIDPVRGHNGRVTLWCADSDPLSGRSLPSPLVGRTEPFDVYREKVQVGYDIRARLTGFSLLERSMLIGGEPGAGKSVGSNNVLCSVALDPRMPMWLIDGKGGADLSDYEDIADRFLAEPDPRALLAIASDAQDDMSDRYAALKRLGEKKLTGEIADVLGFHQAFFHIDELQFFMASKLGDEIVDALWDLVSRGRAAGWSVSAATQRPAAEVVPSKLRDILSIRWALSCTTPQASDTILGQGYASRGFNAQTIDIEEQRGGGYLKVGATPVLMRTGMLTDNQIKVITRRAYALREAAGTLPKSDARPSVRLLKAMLATMGEADRMHTTDLLAELAGNPAYEGWDATRLADELRPVGVSPSQLAIDGVNRNGYRRGEVLRALDRA